MGNFVASNDVSNELKHMSERIDKQDTVLEEVSKSVHELVRLQERQISLAEKVTDIRTEMKEMKATVTTNHAKLSNVAGIGIGVSISISVALTVFTIILPLIRS
jgi:methyl-accepting chemotaxis protein